MKMLPSSSLCLFSSTILTLRHMLTLFVQVWCVFGSWVRLPLDISFSLLCRSASRFPWRRFCSRSRLKFSWTLAEYSRLGTTYCWGVIQGALVADGLSSASTLSWIGSIAVACNAILAIISARILRSLGSRLTAFAGVSFLAGSEILSGFTVHNVGASING